MKRAFTLLLVLTLLLALPACGEQRNEAQFEFSYEIGKKRFEPGERVEIVVKATNVGRNYRYVGADYDLFGPATLSYASASVDYQMPAPPFANSDDATERVFKRGETVSRTYYFDPESTSPQGAYDLELSFAGETVRFDGVVTLSAPMNEQDMRVRAAADAAILDTYPITDLTCYEVKIAEMSEGRGFSVYYRLTIGGYKTWEEYSVTLSPELAVTAIWGEYGKYACYLPHATADNIRRAEEALTRTLENEGFGDHSGFYLGIDEQGYLCLNVEVIVDTGGNGQHEHLFFREVICGAVELNAGGAENFNFSLTWGCFGISSYDSFTGRLVKTTDTTHPKDYIAEYKLSAAERERIYALLQELDVSSYPDTYNPHTDGTMSAPSMSLILTVNDGATHKRINALNIALTYESNDPKGQKFLTACREIEKILTSTEEWKAMPDYEFLYE